MTARQNVPTIVLITALASACSSKKESPVNDKKPTVTVPESALKGVVRTNLDSPNPTDAQLTRKKKSEARVHALGLPVNANLPVVEDDGAVQPRTDIEVAQRCIAVAICAVKGESDDQELTDKLVEEYSAASFFSPEEDRFRRNTHASKQDLTKFGWRYEAVHVFLWALGYAETINAPNTIADAGHDIGILKTQGKNFVANAHLRSRAEILDMSDLYYRLDWAAVELRVEGKHNDAIDGEIVVERHRALNWLIRYMNQAWDDVTTAT